LGLRINQGLVNLIDEVSGKDELAKKYDNQNAFFLEPVHGEDVLEEAIEKLEPMFQRRIRAVEVSYHIAQVSRNFDMKIIDFIARILPLGPKN
jgi:hypothetical protein